MNIGILEKVEVLQTLLEEQGQRIKDHIEDLKQQNESLEQLARRLIEMSRHKSTPFPKDMGQSESQAAHPVRRLYHNSALAPQPFGDAPPRPLRKALRQSTAAQLLRSEVSPMKRSHLFSSFLTHSGSDRRLAAEGLQSSAHLLGLERDQITFKNPAVRHSATYQSNRVSAPPPAGFLADKIALLTRTSAGNGKARCRSISKTSETLQSSHLSVRPQSSGGAAGKKQVSAERIDLYTYQNIAREDRQPQSFEGLNASILKACEAFVKKKPPQTCLTRKFSGMKSN